jgi:hypothetical protein
VAKVGTSNSDRTIILKRLQGVVENKHKHVEIVGVNLNLMTSEMFPRVIIFPFSLICSKCSLSGNLVSFLEIRTKFLHLL